MPEPEHEGSRRMARTFGTEAASTVRKSSRRASTIFAPPAWSTRFRSSARRRASRSRATTAPRPASSAAACVVLFPGAAHASRTSPRHSKGTSSNSAAAEKHDALSWSTTRPEMTRSWPPWTRFAQDRGRQSRSATTASSTTLASKSSSAPYSSRSAARTDSRLAPRKGLQRMYRGSRSSSATGSGSTHFSWYAAFKASSFSRTARSSTPPPLGRPLPATASYVASMSMHASRRWSPARTLHFLMA
mmetsp:Transcript_4703/g.14940  ORF Transcript_4703/g.14940 Transcript_4703/m.14940 type:complete len:246 (+) Transcript_4703:524-1261(+)